MSGGDRHLLIWCFLLSSYPILLSGAASDRLLPHPTVSGVKQGVLLFLTELSLEWVS